MEWWGLLPSLHTSVWVGSATHQPTRVRVSLPAPPPFPHSLTQALTLPKVRRSCHRASDAPSKYSTLPDLSRIREFGNCGTLLSERMMEPAALSPHFPRRPMHPGCTKCRLRELGERTRASDLRKPQIWRVCEAAAHLMRERGCSRGREVRT